MLMDKERKWQDFINTQCEKENRIIFMPLESQFKLSKQVVELSPNVTDNDFYEGLQEIINNLKSIEIKEDSDKGEKRMLSAILWYLESIEQIDEKE